MTPQQIEAMKLALEALELLTRAWQTFDALDYGDNAITALEEALAEHAMGEVQRLGQEIEPDDIASILACRDMLDAQLVPEVDRVIWPERTEQEPVQYKCTVTDDQHPNGIPLEQWAKPPLTDKRVWTFWDLSGGDIADAIKAKLKEKNK